MTRACARSRAGRVQGDYWSALQLLHRCGRKGPDRAVIVNGVLITRWPPDTSVARVHLPALKSVAIVEIADPQVKAAALDRDLLNAAHLLEPEEVVP